MSKIKNALIEYGECRDCAGAGFTRCADGEPARCAFCGGVGLDVAWPAARVPTQ